MLKHFQRPLAFAVLSSLFGVTVWAADIAAVKRNSLLAAGGASTAIPNTSATTATTPQTVKGNATDSTNDMCPAQSATAAYNSGASKYPQTYCSGGTQVGAVVLAAACMSPKVQKQNLYGKPCWFDWQNLRVTGECIAPKKCKGVLYKGEDKKEYRFSEDNQQPGENWQEQGEQGKIRVACASNECWFTKSGDSLGYKPSTDPKPSSGNTGITDTQIGKQPVATKPVVNTDIPAYGSGNNPREAINSIANAGPSTPGPQNTIRPTFQGSPGLSNIGNWAFGNNSSGGGNYSGGGIAYVQQGDPGYYNRNFESAESQVTFPEPRTTPEQILAYLAENTKKLQAGSGFDQVTAGDLLNRGPVGRAVVQAINAVVTPVGDFVKSFFSSGEPPTEAANSQGNRDRPPLERGRLVLTLSSDDSLVPGDPTSIANLRRPQYEAFDTIAESNRGWVQSAPRAGEGIEQIANEPPTFGWGGASEGDGSGGQGASGERKVEPDVSDVPFEPFFPQFGFNAEQDEIDTIESPRTLFTPMAKSFSTIGDAVSSLFSTIGKSLFWWL